MSTETEIETGLNVAATVGAVVGGPTGATVAALLPAAETAVNAVIAEAPHQTALTDIVNAVAAAAPVVNSAATSLAPADAANVASSLSLIQKILADVKSWF